MPEFVQEMYQDFILTKNLDGVNFSPMEAVEEIVIILKPLMSVSLIVVARKKMYF